MCSSRTAARAGHRRGPRPCTAAGRVVLLEQGVHLETCVELQEASDLWLGQRAGAIGLDRDGLE